MNLKLSRTALRELTRLYRGVLMAAMISAAFVASGANAEAPVVKPSWGAVATWSGLEEQELVKNDGVDATYDSEAGTVTANISNQTNSTYGVLSNYFGRNERPDGDGDALAISSLNLVNSTFDGNVGYNERIGYNDENPSDSVGGAVTLWHEGEATGTPVEDTEFPGGTVINPSNSIANSSFTNNSAKKGGAVALLSQMAFDENNTTTITGTTFDSNHATGTTGDVQNGAGALFVEGSNVTVSDSRFTRNTATTKGGAVYVRSGASLTATNTTFGGVDNTDPENLVSLGNTADYGGAIYNDGTMEVGGTFENNDATKEGGAIYNSGTLTVADGTVFKSNSANMGAGIANHGSAAVLEIGDNVKFQDNFLTGADKHGSVLYNKEGTVTIGDNFSMEKSSLGSIHDCGIYSNEGGDITIGDNFSVSNFWEAMVIAGSGSMSFGDNATFENNRYGLNLYSGDYEVTFGENASFENNNSWIFQIKNYASDGASITFDDGLVVKNNNNTTSGEQFGNIYNGTYGKMVFGDAKFEDNSTQLPSGNAGVFQNWNKLVFNGETEFSGNAANGVAGAIRNRSAAANSEFNDTVSFTGNKALSDGGAIINEGTMTFAKEASFSGNIAGAGQDYVEDENGIYVEYDDETGEELGRYKLVLTDEAVNAANGGAIHNTNTVTFADKTSFTDNVAGNLGGAVYNTGNLTFKDDAIFSNNIANEAKNDIYNAGTINLTAGTGKTLNMALDGGIDGTGAINMNGTGSVAINGNVKDQTITVSSGEYVLSGTNTKTTFEGSSSVAVNSGAALTTLDNEAVNYSGVVTLNDGATISLDADFNTGATDAYTITSGATVNVARLSLINALNSNSISEDTILRVGANEKGNISLASSVTDSIKAYTSEFVYGVTGNSANNGQISLVKTGASTGFDQAVDDTDDAQKTEFVYDITNPAGETFTNGDKTIANADAVLHGNDKTVTATPGVQSIVVKDNSTFAADNVTLESFGGPAINNFGSISLEKVTIASSNAQAIKNTGYAKVVDSNILSDVDNSGYYESDPSTYSGKFTNTSFASFEDDTFTGTAELANTGDVELTGSTPADGVTFEAGATITGDGDLYLLSGTTQFNNTANSNDVYLAKGAKFNGTLIGGSFDSMNNSIDTGLGSIQNADLYIDAKLSGDGTADAFAGTTGSTIKEITIVGNDYNATKDELKIAVGSASLDENVVINGMNYYTKVEKDGSDLVFSDKLINTSTIRGTGDGTTTWTGDVVIGDKAETTTVGTLSGFAETNDTYEYARLVSVDDDDVTRLAKVTVTGDDYLTDDVTATLYAQDTSSKKVQVEANATDQNVTVTAANGLIISDGATSPKTTTLTATADGLNVAEGLTVATDRFTVDTAGKVTAKGGADVTGSLALFNSTDSSKTASLSVDSLGVITTGNASVNTGTGTVTAGAVEVGTTGTGFTNAGALKLAGTTVTSTAAELNLLHGMTAVQTTKITGTGSTTTLATTAAVAATTGKIDGLISDNGDGTYTYNGSATSTNLDGSGFYTGNLAVGTTIEDHLVALDNAIGDRVYTTGTGYYLTNGQTVTASLDALNVALHDATAMIGVPPAAAFTADGALDGFAVGDDGDASTTNTTLFGALDTLSQKITNHTVDAGFKTMEVADGSGHSSKLSAITDGSTGSLLSVNTGISVNGNETVTGSLTAGGGKFQVDTNGTIQDVRGIYVSNGSTTAPKVGLTVTDDGTNSTLNIGDDTLVKGTFGAGTNGTEFTVAADGSLAVATNKFTVNASTGNTDIAGSLKVGSSDQFQVTNAGAVTTTSTLTADGESKFGKNGTTYALDVATDKVTANQVVEAKNGVKFGTATGEKVMTSVKQDAVAALDASGNDQKLVSATAVAATREAINTELNAQLGGIFTVNADKTLTYKDTALAGNGFETGATTLVDELTKYAGNVQAATGTTYAADGAATTDYVDKTATDTASYVNIANGTSLKAAIDQIDKNIGTAMTATGSGRTTDAFKTATTKTVNQNLSALDAAIGADMTSAGRTTVGVTAAANSVNANLTAIDAYLGGDVSGVSRTKGTVANATVKANIEALDAAIGTDAELLTTTVTTGAGQNNGVAVANSVNRNVAALNAAVGDVATLKAGTGSTGNAITNGTGTAATTVVQALNNIDATLGQIHGLKNGHSHLQAKSNLADGTTVEQHLIALDDAVGDRTQYASARYVNPTMSNADAIMSLDHNLDLTEQRVRRVEKEMRGGFASMAAMAALVPNARAAGDTQLSVGVGAYRDHQGIAVGGFHYFNDNILTNVGVSYGGDKSTVFRAGVTFGW